MSRQLPVFPSRVLVIISVVALVVLLLASAVAAGGAPGEAAGETTTVEYTVIPGDTLWSIAAGRVGPDGDPRPVIDHIRRINGLDSSVIRTGQTLLVPLS